MTRPEASRLLSLYSPEAWLQNAWQMRAHRHSGRTSHCRGASNWRCGAHLPPASILGRQTRVLRGVRTAVATPVRYRGAASAARVVWRESVGNLSEPVRTCRHRLNQRDEVAPTGGTPPQVMDVPVRDGSTWAKGGFQRNTRFEGRTSSLTRLARQGAIGVPPRCPPATTPGHPGGQLATHATHTPVIDGAGHAFAMRRPGVRIPAAPPTDTRLTSANGDMVARVSSMRLASAPLMPPA